MNGRGPLPAGTPTAPVRHGQVSVLHVLKHKALTLMSWNCSDPKASTLPPPLHRENWSFSQDGTCWCGTTRKWWVRVHLIKHSRSRNGCWESVSIWRKPIPKAKLNNEKESKVTPKTARIGTVRCWWKLQKYQRYAASGGGCNLNLWYWECILLFYKFSLSTQRWVDLEYLSISWKPN